MQDKLKFPSFVKLGRLKQLSQSDPFKGLPLRGRRTITYAILLIVVTVGLFFIFQRNNKQNKITNTYKSKFASILNKNIPISSPKPTFLPTPTPTPRPLTLAEMNTLYGPCTQLPVFMYHHIQTKEAAEAHKQVALTVYTDFFKDQMQYLKDRNYNVLTMSDLVNFFDSGTPVPKHSVLLTFDDGYTDFYSDAFPILKDLNFKTTVFTPTGLMNNPDYLTWDQISEMKGLVLFANHTWSHKNVGVSTSSMQYEISTADTQLTDHGLNFPKVFAYPYGLTSSQAEKYLAGLGYKLAFMEGTGSILCKKQRFNLTRIRIGNASLSSYGF